MLPATVPLHKRFWISSPDNGVGRQGGGACAPAFFRSCSSNDRATLPASTTRAGSGAAVLEPQRRLPSVTFEYLPRYLTADFRQTRNASCINSLSDLPGRSTDDLSSRRGSLAARCDLRGCFAWLRLFAPAALLNGRVNRVPAAGGARSTPPGSAPGTPIRRSRTRRWSPA